MPLAPSRVLATRRYAMYFDGIDDYVKVNDSQSLQLVDALTFVAWVKSNVTNYGDVWLGVASKSPQQFLVARSNYFFGSIIKDAAGNLFYIGFVSGLDMNWHHYALTYDRSLPSGNLKRYLDGVIIAQGTSTAGLYSTAGAPLYLGGGGGKGLSGLIHEVRIYRRALSQTEIQYIMNHLYNPISNDLVLWLQAHPDYIKDIDGDGILEWIDLSGNNNHGKIYGATLVSTCLPPYRTLTPSRLLEPVQ
jgi:hypothetical protein